MNPEEIHFGRTIDGTEGYVANGRKAEAHQKENFFERIEQEKHLLG